LLEQVFVNLLENAAKYSGTGSIITIAAAIDGSLLRISVADNGPGLAPGTEDRVFDKFYRGTPVSDGGRGSGLGLAISRAIVLSHNGTITASNRPTGGAEFVIHLPLINNAPRVVIE
jgi:two-component system, OmpR family, sensor histidine kinase KdpD